MGSTLRPRPAARWRLHRIGQFTTSNFQNRKAAAELRECAGAFCTISPAMPARVTSCSSARCLNWIPARGKPALSDLRSNTWEDGNARKFRFSSENLFNERRTDIVDGHAERNAKAVAVSLSKPKEMSFNVTEGAVFPTEHMRRIIAAAREGKSVLEFPVYDGSESGEKLFNTLTVIGRPISPGEKPPNDAVAKTPALAKLTRWPVTISYFDKKDDKAEQGANRRRSIRSASSSTRMAFRVPWSSTTPISRSPAR